MGLGDLLGGKTKTYKADPLAKDINAAGKLGLGQMTNAANELNDSVYNSPTDYIHGQIDTENKMLRGSANDTAMGLRKMIAQRGMGNSSVGIGQEVNLNKQLNDNIAMNNASTGSRLKDLLNEKMQTGQNLYGVKAGANGAGIQMQKVQQKQGGLAPLLGAGLGAYLGGAQGAQVGMGLGQYMAN